VPGAAQLLRETARTRDPAWPPTINQVCATLLETTAAQINGQPQARAMVDSLDRLLQSGPALIGMSWQNLAVAGLLEKEGLYARAAAAARRTRQYYAYIPFLATYYREAGRLAERAGERDRAIEGYARYLDLRKDAEPALQEEVNQVKQALARLTAEKQ
jgi:tetratricopeptide (TPR) repeat protein